MIRSIEIAKNLYLAEFTPEQKAQDEVQKSVKVNHVYCCDISGSMYNSLPKMRQQLKNRIPDLVSESDTLTIIVFSGSNECTTLKECVSIKNAKDLKALNDAIDKFMTPQGCTSFYDPVVMTNELVSRMNKSDELWSFIFLSDGGNNDHPWADVIKALSDLQPKISSTAVIEYGYYADSQKLTEMAETLGGEKIFSEDFDSYEMNFERVLTGKTEPRIPLDITEFKGSMKYQQMFSIDEAGNSVKVFSTERTKEVLVPSRVETLYFLSKEQVGETILDPEDAESAMYAAIQICADRLRYDVTEHLLSALGDKKLITLYCNAFGKQKLAEFKESALDCVFSEDLRFVDGIDKNFKPNPNAYCVLDLIDDLMSEEENQICVCHPRFNYSRIGAKSVVKQILTEEQKQKLSKAATKLKADKVLEEVDANAVHMEYADTNAGFPISNLTWNEDRANLSVLLKIDVNLTMPKNDLDLTTVPSFIWRNYTIIKDGILNVTTLPVYLGELTVAKLKKKGIITDSTETLPNGIIILEFGNLPIVNKKRTESVVANDLATLQCSMLHHQFEKKYLGYLKKKYPIDVDYTSTDSGFTREQLEYLASKGITLDKGYSPQSELDKSGDFYMAMSLKVGIKGFSSIPKIEDVMKKSESGKSLTPSESLMFIMMSDINDKVNNIPESKKPEEIERMFDSVTKVTRTEMESIAKQKFGLIMSRKWFKDKSGFDDNQVIVKINGNDTPFTFEFKEVKQNL